MSTEYFGNGLGILSVANPVIQYDSSMIATNAEGVPYFQPGNVTSGTPVYLTIYGALNFNIPASTNCNSNTKYSGKTLQELVNNEDSNERISNVKINITVDAPGSITGSRQNLYFTKTIKDLSEDSSGNYNLGSYYIPIPLLGMVDESTESSIFDATKLVGSQIGSIVDLTGSDPPFGGAVNLGESDDPYYNGNIVDDLTTILRPSGSVYTNYSSTYIDPNPDPVSQIKINDIVKEDCIYTDNISAYDVINNYLRSNYIRVGVTIDSATSNNTLGNTIFAYQYEITDVPSNESVLGKDNFSGKEYDWCTHEDKLELERVEATCTTPGHIKYQCNACGKVITDPIPALRHNIVYKYYVRSSNGIYVEKTESEYNSATTCKYIKLVCSTCKEVLNDCYDEYHPQSSMSSHEVQEATCTTPGHTAYEECGVCHKTFGYSEISPLGHDWETEIIEPSLHGHNPGGTKYTCKRCDTINMVWNGEVQHTWDLIENVPATCEDNGYEHYKCHYCDETTTETIGALGHNYSTDWTVDKEATSTEEGSKSHHCTRCDAKTDITVIPATGGDFSQIGIAIASGNTDANAFITKYNTFSSCNFYNLSTAEVYENLVNLMIRNAEVSGYTVNIQSEYENGNITAQSFNIAYTDSNCDSHIDMYLNVNGYSNTFSSTIDAFGPFKVSADGKNSIVYNILQNCQDTSKYTNICYKFSTDQQFYELEDLESIRSSLENHFWEVERDWSVASDYNTEDIQYTDSEQIILLQCTATGDCKLQLKRTIVDSCPPHNYIDVFEYFNTNDAQWELQIEGTDYSDMCTRRRTVCSKCGEGNGTAPEYIRHVYEPVGLEKCEGVSCSTCGEQIPGQGHDIVEETSLHGHTITKHCNRCGNDLETTFVHSYTDKQESLSVAPTCTEDGYDIMKCHYCDDTQTVTIPATGHTFGEWIVDKEATTEEDGSKHHTCAVCGHEETKVIPKLEETHTHSYTEEITKEPTCTEKGVKTFTCSCGDSYTEDINALGHTEVVDAAKAATCTETGLTEGKHCSVCGEILIKQEEILALGHTEVVDKVVAPTCTEKGLTEGKHCSVCGEVIVKQEVIPALGHKYISEITKEPTCTEKGIKTFTCSVCGNNYTEEIATLGHTEVIDKAVAPTCTEAGLTKGKHCSRCGEILVAQQVVPALGHKEVIDKAVAPTYNKTGLTEGKHCSVCGKVLIAQEVLSALGGGNYSLADGKFEKLGCSDFETQANAEAIANNKSAIETNTARIDSNDLKISNIKEDMERLSSAYIYKGSVGTYSGLPCGDKVLKAYFSYSHYIELSFPDNAIPKDATKIRIEAKSSTGANYNFILMGTSNKSYNFYIQKDRYTAETIDINDFDYSKSNGKFRISFTGNVYNALEIDKIYFLNSVGSTVKVIFSADTYTINSKGPVIDSTVTSVKIVYKDPDLAAEQKSTLQIGDVYNVSDSDKNYAWNGKDWDSLGGTFSLTNYQTREDTRLNTTSKYVVGAINELKTIIDNEATSSNDYILLNDNTTSEIYKLYVDNGKLTLELHEGGIN